MASSKIIAKALGAATKDMQTSHNKVKHHLASSSVTMLDSGPERGVSVQVIQREDKADVVKDIIADIKSPCPNIPQPVLNRLADRLYKFNLKRGCAGSGARLVSVSVAKKGGTNGANANKSWAICVCALIAKGNTENELKIVYGLTTKAWKTSEAALGDVNQDDVEGYIQFKAQKSMATAAARELNGQDWITH